MTDYTTIHVQQKDVDDLDAYAEAYLGTIEVPHRIVIQHLLHQNND